jgi:SAM-dependent methyltransferase
MPIDQSLLSKYLRKTGIFLDASLHEGFGLMPLEALACGCWLVLSDSGGIRDYAIQNVNSDIISRLNQPEEYVSAIQARIGAGAAPDVIIESLASIPTDYKHYLDLFEKILKKEIHPRTHDEMDDSSSDDIRSELLQYLREIGQLNIEKNADELLSLEGGFAERFSFFTPFLPESAKERMLISGCAVGSEHFVADRHGFKEIYGTEVAGQYVNMAKRRFQKHDRFHVALYDGKRLPFKDGFFTTIYSGHIIEHTPSPYRYFAEHMRALAAGGFFFIEFPDRYHPVELHTGMKSCEWLPSPFRFIVLKFLASPRSGLSERKRKYYDLILKTLSPVSIWQIRLYLLAAGCPGSRVVACNKPAPGFVRILIQK